MKKYLIAACLLVASVATQAQMRVNLGENSPLNKLRVAEMAITNLYVDTL